MNMTIKQISPEYWLVTLTITEEGKMPNSRDFVVNVEQLAFLNVWTDLQEKREAKARLEEAQHWHNMPSSHLCRDFPERDDCRHVVSLQRAAGEETK